MRVEKKSLNDALRVLGKVVCQTSPVELYQQVRFVGSVDGIKAMATDGVETVSVAVDADPPWENECHSELFGNSEQLSDKNTALSV